MPVSKAEIQMVELLPSDIASREELTKLRNDIQLKINLLDDRILRLERLFNEVKAKKMCGRCSGTGKVILGRMYDPPIGECGICNGTGYI